MKINGEQSMQSLQHSPSISTALVPFIGYHKASILAKEMKQNNVDIYSANEKYQFIAFEKLQQLLQPQNLLKLGFSLTEID